MDKDTIDIIKQVYSLVKVIHEAGTAYAILPYVYLPVCTVALGLFATMWAYHKSEMTRKDKVASELVDKLDAARKGEIDAHRDHGGDYSELVRGMTETIGALTNAVSELKDQLGGRINGGQR